MDTMGMGALVSQNLFLHIYIIYIYVCVFFVSHGPLLLEAATGAK